MNSIIASFPAHPSVSENTGFIINGFLFVLAVLAVLALLTVVIGKLIQLLSLPKAKAATGAQAKPASTGTAMTSAPSEETVSDHVLAIITAAAHVALEGRPHRIREVRQAPPGSWAQEGRRQIFSSHRVR